MAHCVRRLHVSWNFMIAKVAFHHSSRETLDILLRHIVFSWWSSGVLCMQMVSNQFWPIFCRYSQYLNCQWPKGHVLFESAFLSKSCPTFLINMELKRRICIRRHQITVDQFGASKFIAVSVLFPGMLKLFWYCSCHPDVKYYQGPFHWYFRQSRYTCSLAAQEKYRLICWHPNSLSVR